MKIWAHRGASAFAPENTLQAFQLALDKGADGLELDVHLSRDGEVMVFHDLTLQRMTNQPGRICDHTLEELKQFDFPIPSLREVYQLANDYTQTHNRPITINVELKTDEELYPAMPAKLLELEREINFGSVIYSSFNHYSLMALRQLQPTAPIGLLYNMGMVNPHLYAQSLQANALHAPWQIIAALPQTVADCHALSIAVHVWTVNDANIMALMQQAGVDALITDSLFDHMYTHHG
ncbi:MAG: glycerophosphodiester phosphodiesterase [Defluviitaleaceae bacterium]|nr:glycerophosphodiester phosphodiesterase [Defluviitaleaceae bacterium]